jgi:hypothetical protein
MDMNTALEALLDDIRTDYVNWGAKALGGDATRDRIREDMNRDFCENLTFEEGRKYIKIVKGDGGQRSVWGFVVATDTDKKFKRGDILKAASWNTPARNKPRGNILEGGYSIAWTGPHYL